MSAMPSFQCRNQTKPSRNKHNILILPGNKVAHNIACIYSLYYTLHSRYQCQQAVRLGGRHNMPPPHLDFWPFDLEVGVGVACDLGYPCAKFRLPRPFGFRVRADVRDIRRTDGRTDRRTDGRTTDADHRIMPPRRGHNKAVFTRELGDNVQWHPSVQQALLSPRATAQMLCKIF